MTSILDSTLTRRAALTAVVGFGSVALGQRCVVAEDKISAFKLWVENFRSRARAKGISDATYSAVMNNLEPDTSVYALQRNQPEFKEPLWKYLNRRVSSWRIEFGRQKLQENAPLFDRIEAKYGVDRYTLSSIWGNESAFGEIVGDARYMRPVIPALAALAFGEPRRRAYWEQELLNALSIIERRWSSPAEMTGSWAGAMGHTQWMPEVWLNIGTDFNNNGKISPFEVADALAGSARYLIERGKYQRGEIWGTEVAVGRGSNTGGSLTLQQWGDLGVKPANGEFPASSRSKFQVWTPRPHGPSFLIGQNFSSIKSYNPSTSYALAVSLLADRLSGKPNLRVLFPGGEPALSLSEMQELQQRLKKLNYDPYYTNGRVSRETIAAIRDFQQKQAMLPTDGYPGLEVLTRLRQITGKL